MTDEQKDLVQRCDRGLKLAAARLHASNQVYLTRTSGELRDHTNEAEGLLLSRIAMPQTWLREALSR